MDAEVVVAAIKDSKYLIQEENVEVWPEKLSDGVVDENVDIHLVRKYFTNDAWLFVKDAIAQKEKNRVFKQ